MFSPPGFDRQRPSRFFIKQHQSHQRRGESQLASLFSWPHSLSWRVTVSALEKTAGSSEGLGLFAETWSCRTGLTFQDAFQRKYAVKPVDWQVAKYPWAWTVGPCFRELIGFWRKRALVSKPRKWGWCGLAAKCQRSFIHSDICQDDSYVLRINVPSCTNALLLWAECAQ